MQKRSWEFKRINQVARFCSAEASTRSRSRETKTAHGRENISERQRKSFPQIGHRHQLFIFSSVRYDQISRSGFSKCVPCSFRLSHGRKNGQEKPKVLITLPPIYHHHRHAMLCQPYFTCRKCNATQCKSTNLRIIVLYTVLQNTAARPLFDCLLLNRFRPTALRDSPSLAECCFCNVARTWVIELGLTSEAWSIVFAELESAEFEMLNESSPLYALLAACSFAMAFARSRLSSHSFVDIADAKGSLEGSLTSSKT
jgi:hypothetical protein